MTITFKSRDFSPAELYNMTSSSKVGRLSDIDGAIDVESFLLFEQPRVDTGEINKVLVIATPEQEYYASNSKTFVNDVEKIIECFKGAELPKRWNVVHKRGKNGRNFITCVL